MEKYRSTEIEGWRHWDFKSDLGNGWQLQVELVEWDGYEFDTRPMDWIDFDTMHQLHQDLRALINLWGVPIVGDHITGIDCNKVVYRSFDIDTKVIRLSLE